MVQERDDDMGAAMFEHTVMMVTAVDDPAEVQAELEAVYPGNLCVARVDHSLAELDAVVERLSGDDGCWSSTRTST